MRLRSILPAAAITAVAGLAAAPALAHNKVVSRSPAKGATVKPPRSVSVTFDKPIRRGTLKVTGPGGRVASVGSGGRDPRKISRVLVELRRGLKAGGYRASYTIKAPDGHTQKGSFTFRVKR